jgi:hypothetical protein
MIFDLTLESCIGFVLCEMFPIVTPLIVILVGIEEIKRQKIKKNKD